MVTLTKKIKQKAIEIGFQKVGIVPAVPLLEAGERFDAWIKNGFQGEMAWINREPEKRSNPTLIFPEAKSLVVVALNYYTPHKHSDNPQAGKLSRYAWGEDYHEILKEKLRQLLAWLETEDPLIMGKICVDTTPIMEKEWAVRAGIGWLGKHSNVITNDYGSWVFLGELILNIELAYTDGIIADHCGTCTKCLDACPTGAIVEPYVVDSRKCISYATIELRDDALPAEITNNLDGWLYGCDICQDVCPWNRFETPTNEARFEPKFAETEIELDTIAQLTPEKYVERFRGSAIKRTKLSGLRRNAAALKRSKI